MSLPNGRTRTAKLIGDQGCVTLPAGAPSALFTPVPVTSTLPDAQTQLWPMGDAVQDGAPAAEIDQRTLAAAVVAAFQPPEGLTAAFVVAHKGRIIAERYAAGSDRDTRLPGWSMGKSVTATLLGQLIHDGALQLWAPAPISGRRRRTHAATSASPISCGCRVGSLIAPQDPDFDPARGYPDHLFVYTGAIVPTGGR